MLALLAEAAACWRAGGWPAGSAAPPVFDRLVGIELRPRVARLARARARRRGDHRRRRRAAAGARRCDAILFFDVLHMMPRGRPGAAGRVDGGAARAGRRHPRARGGRRRRLAIPGGRAGNRFKAWRSDTGARRSTSGPSPEWVCAVRTARIPGCRPSGTGDGTPFANVLFVLTRPRRRARGPRGAQRHCRHFAD